MSSKRDPSDRESLILRRIVRAISRTRLILLWEDLWPRLAPLLVVAGLFALASWFGLWLVLPDWLHLAMLILFGVAALLSLVPFIGLRFPDRDAAFSRLEQRSGLPNRPATGFFDRLATSTADPGTKAIWEAHRARLVAEFGPLKTGIPSPGLPRRDPYGLRFLLLLLLVVAFVAAGGGWFDRIADAFRGGTAFAAESVTARIDAWAQPPGYTGLPSIFLTGPAVRADDEAITVPAGTEVVVRLAGGNADALDVTLSSPVAGSSSIAPSPSLANGSREFRVSLSADSRVAVVDHGRESSGWSFKVTPDIAPTITVTDEPGRANAGGLQVGYAFTDDYGVTDAWADFARTTLAAGSHPLVGPPDYRLIVPQAEASNGNAVTVRDISEHPWAGLEVDMTLVAEDGLGQQGTSDAYRVILPGRVFTNPVAKGLIAARQTLALDAHQAPAVAATIDRLTTDNQADLPSLGAYLALRSAYHRLVLANTDDELRDVVDYLWDIAVALEGDPLADAATALQAAADALQEALDRNAPAEEIAALTERLRQAMQDYMQAAAAGAGDTQPATTGNVIRPEQLDGMVDQMQQLAETGDRAAAEQLLNQLQQLMQNLDVTNLPGIDFQPDMQAIDDLTYLMQQEQQLMDQTFALQQQQNEPLPQPNDEEEALQLLDELRQQRADQAAQAADLAHQQRMVQAQLEQLIERLMGNGGDPGQLDDALNNMGAAGDRLDQGQPGLATDRQAEAIEQMRAYGEAMAERQTQEAQRPTRQDPAGRTEPAQGQGYGDQNVALPDEIDVQRAREILDIIRQRLGETDRPLPELQYLERLLERY
jgi:uncharacterized protein (TIGR02302 family)